MLNERQKHFNQVMRSVHTRHAETTGTAASPSWYQQQFQEICTYFPTQQVTGLLVSEMQAELTEIFSDPQVVQLLDDYMHRSRGVIWGQIERSKTHTTIQDTTGEVLSRPPQDPQQVFVALYISLHRTNDVSGLHVTASDEVLRFHAENVLRKVVDALIKDLDTQRAAYTKNQQEQALRAGRRELGPMRYVYITISCLLIAGMVSYGPQLLTEVFDAQEQALIQEYEAFLRSAEGRAALLDFKQRQLGDTAISSIAEQGYDQGINIQQLLDEPYPHDGKWYQNIAVQIEWLDAQGNKQTAVERIRLPLGYLPSEEK